VVDIEDLAPRRLIEQLLWLVFVLVLLVQVPSEGRYCRQNLLLTCTNKDPTHGTADHQAWDHRYWWDICHSVHSLSQ